LWSLSQAELGLGHLSPAKEALDQAEQLFRAVDDKRGLSYVARGRKIYRAVLKNPRQNPIQIP
jgi:hypothetical protein